MALITFSVFAVGLTLLAAFVIFFSWMHGARIEEKPRDALIILGYRSEQGRLSPLLIERLETGLRLIRNHAFTHIIVSGGAVGSDKSEAWIMKRYLIARGVDADRIVMEDASRNTVENLIYCKRIMDELRASTCLIVSNSFHIRRVRFIAGTLGMIALVYAERNARSILGEQFKSTFSEIRYYIANKKLLTHGTAEERNNRKERMEDAGGEAGKPPKAEICEREESSAYDRQQ